MLLAEIHGHGIPEAKDNEDNLTSTVFGHVRYVPPAFFWEDFLACARSIPIASSEKSLTECLNAAGCSIASYARVRAIFWPRHAAFGTPDLILCFSGTNQRPFVLVVEAKLWSDKSGTGQYDQLGRYLDILDDLSNVDPPLASAEIRNAFCAVLYLTPGESVSELIDTLSHSARYAHERLFRVQWQDIIEAARHLLRAAVPSHYHVQMILQDVTDFLRHRGLEYFRGFRRCQVGPFTSGNFYAHPSAVRGPRVFNADGGFIGFTRHHIELVGRDVARYYFGDRTVFHGFAHCIGQAFQPQKGEWSRCQVNTE
jgi:hypothetical protein